MSQDSLPTENDKFSQLCVIRGLIVEDSEDFISFLTSEFECRFKFAESVTTIANNDGDGGRIDVLFYVHNDDITKFAVPRLMYGISWWEDVLANAHGNLYSNEILSKYPKTW